MKIFLALATAKQQETAAFKKWFARSKVVGKDGKPLRVYHGTKADLRHFDSIYIPKGNNENGVGFYFTSKPEWTDLYAGGEGGNVVPVYLKIQNPVHYEKQPRMTTTQARKFMFRSGNKNTANFLRDNYDVEFTGLERAKSEYADLYDGMDLIEGSFNLYNDLYQGKPAEHMFAEIFKDITGYDGIIIDRANGGAKNYVVFTPTQIKSAVGNKGTFKPRTPDITE